MSSILAKIRAEMGAPEVVSNPKEDVDTTKKDVFTPGKLIYSSMKQKIEDILASKSSFEIELSFGKYIGNKFIPGILSATQFMAVLNMFMNDKSWSLTTQQDVVELMGIEDPEPDTDQRTSIRKITDKDKGDVIWQSKTRFIKDSIENALWGYRISKSEETFIDEPDNFSPSLIRERRRFIFKQKHSKDPKHGFSFDITQVLERNLETGKSRTRFELEIERISSLKKTVKSSNLEAAIEYVLLAMQECSSKGELLSLDARNVAIDIHNNLFKEEETNNGRLFSNYWNKPINIKVDDLLEYRNKYAVTIKLDGTRRFILLKEDRTFVYAPPLDVWYRGPGIKEYADTLLDVEMYIEKENDEVLEVKYYVFDILFYQGQDVRNRYFDERVKLATEVVRYASKALFKGGLVMKTFFMDPSENLYSKTSKALEIIRDENFKQNVDGLIFQPQGPYINKSTRKWKPKEAMSIDFLLRRIDDEEGSSSSYTVMVSENKKLVPFRGTKKYPLVNNILVTDEIDSLQPDGLVVECRWDEDALAFVPMRLRLDKEFPNVMETARDVWEDIVNPISPETIEGDSLIALRRFHNIFKESMLKQNFSKGATIMDWGSGRGGDIPKWNRLGLKKVYAVEPNQENLSELLKRKKSVKESIDIQIIRDSEGRSVGAEETEVLKEALQPEQSESEKGTVFKGLDGIVSFFSLTFFAKDEELFDSMIQSIALLPPGGKFIGIVMDGDRTLDFINNKPKVDEVETFSIKMKGKANHDFGDKIVINLEDETSMVKSQTEWLFYFEFLQRKLQQKGFTLLRNGFIELGDMYSMLPKYSKIFSSLNRWFIFQKGESKIDTNFEVTMPDVISSFPNIYNIENVCTIGIVRDNSSFIHAILRAVYPSYFVMDSVQKNNQVQKLRVSIGKNLKPSVYEKLNEGDIARVFTIVAKKKYKGVTDERARELGFLEYKNKWIDYKNQVIGEESGLELLSKKLGINIFVLNSSSKSITHIYGTSCKRLAALYSHEKSVIVATKDGINYSLVARKETDKYMKTSFKETDELIQAIKEDIFSQPLCKEEGFLNSLETLAKAKDWESYKEKLLGYDISSLDKKFFIDLYSNKKRSEIKVWLENTPVDLLYLAVLSIKNPELAKASLDANNLEYEYIIEAFEYLVDRNEKEMVKAFLQSDKVMDYIRGDQKSILHIQTIVWTSSNPSIKKLIPKSGLDV